MINQEFFDEKDRQINRLKITIEQFKKYDAERKQYYADKMQKLGELESYVQELEDGSKVFKLKETIKNQRKELSRLNAYINAANIDTSLSVSELYNTVASLKAENTELRRKLRISQDSVKELVMKLNKQ